MPNFTTKPSAFPDIDNPLQFKGQIDLNSDFPTSAEVENGWFYTIGTNVTDNDPSKTNTGQSFLAGDEIAWNGVNWTKIGSTALWIRTGDTLEPTTANDNIDIGSGDFTATGTISDGTSSLTGGSLTDVKLGSLTTNGFVKTGSGDGTLSVDTNTYLTTISGEDHSTLANLDYASAGHTGFEPTVTKGNLTAGSNKIDIGGTGTGALIGAGATVDVNEANISHAAISNLTWSAAGHTMDAVLDMNTHQINGVVDPSLDQDAATKNYVDGLTANHPHQDVNTTASPSFVGVTATGFINCDGNITAKADLKALHSASGENITIGMDATKANLVSTTGILDFAKGLLQNISEIHVENQTNGKTFELLKVDGDNLSTIKDNVMSVGSTKALNFNGTDDGISVPSLGASSTCTIAAWVRTEDLTKWQCIFSEDGGFSVFINWTTSSDGRIYIVKDNVALQTATTGIFTIANDTWTHIAVTQNGTAQEIFINGASVNTGTATNAWAGGTAAFAKRGNSNDGNLEGDLDEVALWSKTLSDNDISDLYAAGVGLLIDPASNFPTDGGSMGTSLERLYHLNDDAATTNVIDDSGNSQDGTLVGGDNTDDLSVVGKVTGAGVAKENTILQSRDGIIADEFGAIELGADSVRNTINGKTIRFNIDGTEVGQIDTNGDLLWANSIQIDDNEKYYLGTASDASIYYDGTNLVIDSKEVGTGVLSILSNTAIGSSATGAYPLEIIHANANIMLGLEVQDAGKCQIRFGNASPRIWVAGIDAGEEFIIGNNTLGTTPFIIKENATDNTIYANVTGVGINTIPDRTLQVTDTITYPFKIENTSVGGACGMEYKTDDQRWQSTVAINGNYFLRDVTNAITPFQILPLAQGNTFYMTSTKLIINNNALDIDFQVKGDTDTVLLYCNAGTDKVGIGTATPSEKLEVNGSIKLTNDNDSLKLGTADDASITYDGTDMIINSQEVTPSDLIINCGTEKTIELQETVWDDYVTPLGPNNWRGTSNNPVLTQLFTNGAGSQGVYANVFSNGDEALMTIQMPHRWKEGTDIYPHIHFMATSDVSPADNFAIEFEYAWADQDEDFPANSTMETVQHSTGENTNNMHQLVNISSNPLEGAGHTISSVLLCRIKRVAADANDYAGGIAILDFDVHYEIDTFGSRQILAK